MSVVYMPGVFDLLHVGHIRILKEASKIADRFIVGIPTDDAVTADKGRPPIIGEEYRKEMLESLPFIDEVLIYSTLDFIGELGLIKPQNFAVGTDWGTEVRHNAALDYCDENQIIIHHLPYTSGVSTSEIITRIRMRDDLRPRLLSAGPLKP
jgi:D-glycero-beta-D-manno-heptose 1-phosphate adenylyltransferase